MAMKSNRILLAVIVLFNVTMHGRSAQKPPTNAAHGTLQVSQKGTGPIFNEGSITFFRVYQNGNLVEEKMLGGNSVKSFDQTRPRATSEGDKNSFSLPPGQYELRAYVRGCDGNCNRLDVPQNECIAPFGVSAGETLEAVRRQTRNGRCTLEMSSKGK
jgi:hypothetical protein